MAVTAKARSSLLFNLVQGVLLKYEYPFHLLNIHSAFEYLHRTTAITIPNMYLRVLSFCTCVARQSEDFIPRVAADVMS